MSEKEDVLDRGISAAFVVSRRIMDSISSCMTDEAGKKARLIAFEELRLVLTALHAGLPIYELGKNQYEAIKELDDQIDQLSQQKHCALCWDIDKASLMLCSGCKKVRYCSAACQKNHRKYHKSTCKK